MCAVVSGLAPFMQVVVEAKCGLESSALLVGVGEGEDWCEFGVANVRRVIALAQHGTEVIESFIVTIKSSIHRLLLNPTPIPRIDIKMINISCFPWSIQFRRPHHRPPVKTCNQWFFKDMPWSQLVHWLEYFVYSWVRSVSPYLRLGKWLWSHEAEFFLVAEELPRIWIVSVNYQCLAIEARLGLSPKIIDSFVDLVLRQDVFKDDDSKVFIKWFDLGGRACLNVKRLDKSLWIEG